MEISLENLYVDIGAKRVIKTYRGCICIREDFVGGW